MADSNLIGGMAVANNQSNGFDLGKWLQNVVQGDPNSPMQNWQGTANGSSMDQMPSSNLPPQAHDAAEKVLNKAYTDFATQIATQHPDGLSILSHLVNNTQPNQQPQQQQSQDNSGGLGDLRPIVINGNPTPGGNPISGNPVATQPQSTEITPEDQVKKNIMAGLVQSTQPKGFFGRWQDNFNKQVGNMTTADQLANLAVAQKMVGGEPIQEADIQKAAVETQQKIAQATMVPPTQAEKMQNAAAYAGYKTTALKDMLDNNNTAMAQANETIKNMQGYSAWGNKLLGTWPKEAQAAYKNLQKLKLERIGISSELNNHQQLLASGGASKSPFVNGQVYTDKSGNKATYKNGQWIPQ